ncbi:VanW family protein [Candidatus Falkowbacteria bacterium]|nr:VanW family protein [Candidatus Falkowbacteria bacterium]
MRKEKNKNLANPEVKIAEATPRKFIIKKWHKIVIAIFLLLIVLPTATVFAFEEVFSDKIFPGVKIGDLNIGGKTNDHAFNLLNETTRTYNEEGVTFIYQNKKASVVPLVTAPTDPDLSRSVFTLDNKGTIEEAMALGRSGNFWNDLKQHFYLLLFGQKLKLKYQLNEEEILAVLKENFGYLEKPIKDAQLEIITNGRTVSTKVSDEEDGQVFDYSSAIDEAFAKVSVLDTTPTPIDFVAGKAKIKKAEATLAADRAKKLAGLCLISVKENKKIWNITQDQIRLWMEFQLTPNSVIAGLNKEKTEEYLKTLAKTIDVAPQNAKFTIENGVVKEFQLHQGGKELNVEASYNIINDYLINFDETKIPASCPSNYKLDNSDIIQLIVKITAPQIPIGSLNNLGIQELVGEGISDFSGSPVNRRHNIAVGAAKLNGVLIAPGEEFSTDKTLGEISGRTGYLQELVIKGDKTIPEYGGGLCQIGTTMFRVALNAGLPITERRPHSYRVVYYEPAGMDATIYSPSPDLKFINDTPAYLLLQTKIDGNELIFELWGTPDGRKVEITTPRVFNFVSPGPTKIVETTDLAPGEKKCTERAHTGADAAFERTIASKDGEIKTETWTSHYVPWSAVCLVGKEPTPPPTEPPATVPTSPSGIPDPALNPLTF